MKQNVMIACLASVLCVLAVSTGAAESLLLKDDFANGGSSTRRAIRGDWKIADGVASCTQDDELYKKFKNHGPIIFYDLPFDDATVRFVLYRRPVLCSRPVRSRNSQRSPSVPRSARPGGQ